MTNLGIIGCSNIADARFLPAAKRVKDLYVMAVAEEFDLDKLGPFCKKYDLEGVSSYLELIQRDDIDAVYIPQPPSLHYKWAKMALEAGKHVLIEKPATTNYVHSKELVQIACKKGLAIHENYMFQYHSQIKWIKDFIATGKIGNVRLYRASFGFPMRAQNDFRYSQALGGGALLDAGGYTAKLATLLLGDTVRVDSSKLNQPDGYEVDVYGSTTFVNDEGTVFQTGFGMDNAYQCSMEIWGSEGKLLANRIFTAGDDDKPTITFVNKTGADVKDFVLEADSHFQNSIEQFLLEIKDEYARKVMYGDILTQAGLIDEMRRLANR